MNRLFSRLHLIVAVCLLMQLVQIKPAYAQRWWTVPDSEKIEVPPNAAPGNVLKTSLISPFLQAGTIRLAYEHHLATNLSVQLEAGYIYRYIYDKQKLNKDKPNFDLKGEVRFYPEQSVLFGLYTGPSLFFRNLNYMEGFLRCAGNDPGDPCYLDYTENLQYRRNNLSLLWVAGLQPVLGRRITVDIQGGAGMTLENDLLTASNVSAGGNNLQRNSSSMYFTATFGIHIGYILRPCCRLPE